MYTIPAVKSHMQKGEDISYHTAKMHELPHGSNSKVVTSVGSTVINL